jgi:uncharacterized membrane protein (DUF2068 family)
MSRGMAPPFHVRYAQSYVEYTDCDQPGNWKWSVEEIPLAIAGQPATNLSIMAKPDGRKREPGAPGEGGIRAQRYGTGTRVVALFEAAKGVVVILAGFGLLALIHRNAQEVVEDIVRHIHFNPAKHFPHIFLDAVASANNSHLWAMAATALVYAGVRFAEAYGLWNQRPWAEWFAILSGSIYLPIEIYELTVSVSVVKVCILLVNLLVVGWLAWVRWQAKDTG